MFDALKTENTKLNEVFLHLEQNPEVLVSLWFSGALLLGLFPVSLLTETIWRLSEVLAVTGSA